MGVRTSGKVLAVDIGNTNITIGRFEGERLRRVWRLETDPSVGAAAYARRITRRLGRGRRGLDGAVCASVVPRLSRVIDKACAQSLGVSPKVVTQTTPIGIRPKVDKPSEVGADRLLNSLAAYRMFGGPVVVVDFGTATTFDCVSAGAEYLGGAILPGPHLAAKALSLHTARLPKVPVEPTRRVIGKNTVECIQAGLYHGYLGMVDRVLRETLKEMRGPGKRKKTPRIPVVATGGLAGLFAKAMPFSRVVPELTLRGLRLAYDTIC